MVTGVKLVGYARVSTDDKGQSVDNQKREIEKWASAHDSDLVAFYSDEMSGAIFPRPGLARALLCIQMGTADYLICYDQSRLTRDAENHLWRIRVFAPNIIYTSDGDLDPDSFSSNLLHAIKGVTDKEERRILGARTKIGMDRRKAEGVHCGRPLKFALQEESSGSLAGRIIPGKTTVITKAQLLTFASMKMSPCYLATNVIHTTPATVYALLERTGTKEEYYSAYNGAENDKKMADL